MNIDRLLALLDPNGDSPDDRLVESYAARRALAYRRAVLHSRS